MSNSRYYIVGDNDVWMIKLKDTENDQYEGSEAASFAIAAAQKLGMRGERAHVCVLDDDDGRLRCTRSDNLPGPIHFPTAVIEFA
jgi:hypothetical protein